MGISWYAWWRAYQCARSCVLSVCTRYKYIQSGGAAAVRTTFMRVHRRCRYVHTCVRRSNILPGPGYVWHTLDIPRRRLDLKFIGRKFFGDRPTSRGTGLRKLCARGSASENDRVETKLDAVNRAVLF